MATRMSTRSAPADPILERYRLYEEDGKILFQRLCRNMRSQYVYYTDLKELWRIRIRTKSNWMRVDSEYRPPLVCIDVWDLTPVWPKHMSMDKGL